MTPPALFALGAGSLVCAVTAMASVLGWPAELRRERERPGPPEPALDPATRQALLGLVPHGHGVAVQALPDPGAQVFAEAALRCLVEAGRASLGPVQTVHGISGTGWIHVAERRHHEILVLRDPARSAAAVAALC
ncbi:MAG TPA: hypothetical protein VE684_10430 [Crenalkalicoccus sp.]|nr:hypothetical protein [Crenalkalicoccus sp.]